jgi:SAM-dependent methyltransferase
MGGWLKPWRLVVCLAIGAALLPVGASCQTVQPPPAKGKDAELAPFVPSPSGVVEKMLEMAEVQQADVVYDLGSGDGRIVIAAAKRYGARGIGFDIDEDLVNQARENARREGVSHLVEFRKQDVMTVDLSPATVVTLYLLPEANMKLRPRILSQLRPGARVVSHDFSMGDWAPVRKERVREPDSVHDVHTLYLWRIGPRRPAP